MVMVLSYMSHKLSWYYKEVAKTNIIDQAISSAGCTFVFGGRNLFGTQCIFCHG